MATADCLRTAHTAVHLGRVAVPSGEHLSQRAQHDGSGGRLLRLALPANVHNGYALEAFAAGKAAKHSRQQQAHTSRQTTKQPAHVLCKIPAKSKELTTAATGFQL